MVPERLARAFMFPSLESAAAVAALAALTALPLAAAERDKSCAP